jgi:hypothetical protein
MAIKHLWDNMSGPEKELFFLFIVSMFIAALVLLVVNDKLSYEYQDCPSCGSPAFYLSEEGKDYLKAAGEEIPKHSHRRILKLEL